MNNSLETAQNKSVKQGDLYQLGKHRLLCGDATNAKNVAALLDGNQIDLVLTDPPYGVSYVESKQDFNLLAKSKRIQNDQQQTEDEYQAFSEQWMGAALPFLAQRNSFYIFNSDKMLFALRHAMDAQKIKFSQLLIWAKQQAVVGRLDYLPQHELIIYGWHGTHRFRKSKDKSLLFCPKPHRSSLHPTMKPVSLLRRLILNSSEIGNVVYEPFSGSGSTLMAAEQTKRRCFTVELDPEYCATIIKRWEQLTKEKSSLITNIYGHGKDRAD
ncbi:MAG: DNA modification methylase [Candidatus Kerfeldbacteria bacterium CG15_BIG_FIL_POST_REV_8_21_14_020_45_12]|uniref:Methyltransferase n=1 Tax=Candidatus Kerfeldbacteria bacterium CG15_BIG_FIL_POST_REV_8_21_14_020_45_12 TaxID=2014247 RepID=A0A2M7H304_9BACT|nr:MAG: DNA modification methylase [Candidatus Kerfeldbacteria bacterium CG15_BIG_FIL_POST_REV_8_21_14_020_45_12]